MNEKFADKIRADYQDASHRCCHVCDKERTVEELVQALIDRTACIQTFTGRVMCFPECWKQYKEQEGL